MYNPDSVFISESELEGMESDDFESLLEGIESDDFESSLEGEFSFESSEEDIFSGAENVFSEFDDGDDLTRITNEINREISLMNESETVDYMDEQMAEFWPALIAALPALIQLAPQAVGAIGSLFNKGTGAKAQQPPTPPAPPGVSAIRPTGPAQPLPANTSIPTPPPGTPTTPGGGAPQGNQQQTLSTLVNLIQSPQVMQLLSGMASGGNQTITGNTGQPVSGSNILGVISSLAGAIAGGAPKESSESTFPEYAISSEGQFLIDPHEAVQEAELILDLIR